MPGEKGFLPFRFYVRRNEVLSELLLVLAAGAGPNLRMWEMCEVEEIVFS